MRSNSTLRRRKRTPDSSIFPVRVFKSEGVNEKPDVADESVEVVGNALKESSSSSSFSDSESVKHGIAASVSE